MKSQGLFIGLAASLKTASGHINGAVGRTRPQAEGEAGWVTLASSHVPACAYRPNNDRLKIKHNTSLCPCTHTEVMGRVV